MHFLLWYKIFNPTVYNKLNKLPRLTLHFIWNVEWVVERKINEINWIDDVLRFMRNESTFSFACNFEVFFFDKIRCWEFVYGFEVLDLINLENKCCFPINFKVSSNETVFEKNKICSNHFVFFMAYEKAINISDLIWF